MAADGSNPVNLTNNPGFDSDPAWSPDGHYIAYIHYDMPQGADEKGTLMVYDVETLEHTPVAPEGMRTYSRVNWKPQ